MVRLIKRSLGVVVVASILLLGVLYPRILPRDGPPPASINAVASSITFEQVNFEGRCPSLKNCADCALLYDACSWCVDTSSCIALGQHCVDAETGYCSAILLFHLPGFHRVIYVGKRSGGPEALVQLHLALLHWGFNSTQETRKRQVGKSLLPFFRQSYATEYANHGVHMVKHADYKHFLATATSRDIFILTETWPCKRGLRFDSMTGARQLQYHLTVQDRMWTYNVSHLYIPDADADECGVFTHSNFMSNAFLNQSRKSTIIPYVSPHIVAMSGEYVVSPRDRSVIIYDGDARFDPTLVDERFRTMLVKAASLKPRDLYKLYRSALCVIDFGMPGLERLVLEGSLFGTPVIVNDELNGQDVDDFPIPRRFRIKGRDYHALNTLLTELVAAKGITARWDAISAEFEPFRTFVRARRVAFYRAVRQYFSDSVHFIVRVDDKDFRGIRVLLVSILAHVPLAVISVVFQSDERKNAFLSDSWQFLNVATRLYLRSSMSFTVFDDRQPSADHALLSIEVLKPNCYVASYDFVGVVAVAYFHHQIQGHNQGFVGRCFSIRALHVSMQSGWEHQAGRSAFSELKRLHFIQRVFVESQEQLMEIDHLRGNALWRELSPYFG